MIWTTTDLAYAGAALLDEWCLPGSSLALEPTDFSRIDGAQATFADSDSIVPLTSFTIGRGEQHLSKTGPVVALKAIRLDA